MIRKGFEKFWSYYMANYKKLMIIPLILVIVFGAVLLNNKIKTGEFIDKDVSLKGGTTITVTTNESMDPHLLESKLKQVFGTDDVTVRVLTEPFSNRVVGYSMQLDINENKTMIMNKLSSIFHPLPEENVSIGYQGPSLAKTFFHEIVYILMFSFLLVSLVSYYYFRNIFATFAIIISVVGDIICILGLMNVLGIKFTTATIGALLMIVGYSTDSNILLSTNILKRREGSLSYRIRKALKTELTQDLSSYTVYFTMLALSNVAIIQHIATILIMGIFFDEIFTLIWNNGLQRLWVEKHGD